MGYTTDFEGRIEIDPPLNADEIAYLKAFNETRRMDRKNGPYFVKGHSWTNPYGDDSDVIDSNSPPKGQPGLWCKWEPTEDGASLQWSGAEKFYDAPEWMDYLIQHFLKPSNIVSQLAGEEFHPFQGHKCNGVISAQGESPDDMWLLHVRDNIVLVEELVATPGGDVKQITKQAIAAPLKQITDGSK